MVTRTGFEPVNAAVKGRCVKPLHQRANVLLYLVFNPDTPRGGIQEFVSAVPTGAAPAISDVTGRHICCYATRLYGTATENRTPIAGMKTLFPNR